jgi:hypothetical protein
MDKLHTSRQWFWTPENVRANYLLAVYYSYMNKSLPNNCTTVTENGKYMHQSKGSRTPVTDPSVGVRKPVPGAIHARVVSVQTSFLFGCNPFSCVRHWVTQPASRLLPLRRWAVPCVLAGRLARRRCSVRAGAGPLLHHPCFTQKPARQARAPRHRRPRRSAHLPRTRLSPRGRRRRATVIAAAGHPDDGVVANHHLHGSAGRSSWSPGGAVAVDSRGKTRGCFLPRLRRRRRGGGRRRWTSAAGDLEEEAAAGGQQEQRQRRRVRGGGARWLLHHAVDDVRAGLESELVLLVCSPSFKLVSQLRETNSS